MKLLHFGKINVVDVIILIKTCFYITQNKLTVCVCVFRLSVMSSLGLSLKPAQLLFMWMLINVSGEFCLYMNSCFNGKGCVFFTLCNPNCLRNSNFCRSRCKTN